MPPLPGVIRLPAVIVTPMCLFGLAQTYVAWATGITARFDARGLGVALVGVLACALLQTIPAARPFARRGLAVLLLFTPALAFPSAASALFAIIAFLFWWLAAAAPLGDAETSSRQDLLADLGMSMPGTRSFPAQSEPTRARDATGPRDVASYGTRLSGVLVHEALGLACLAIAAACVPLRDSLPDHADLLGTLVFLLASVASWEQAFRALHVAGGSSAFNRTARPSR